MDESATETSVSLIGVGDMGTAIALAFKKRRLDGTRVRPVSAASRGCRIGWDRNVSPMHRPLLAQSELVLVVVDGEAAFGAVAAEVVDCARPGTVVVVHTTLRPDVLVEFAEKCSGNGVSVVDGPP